MRSALEAIQDAIHAHRCDKDARFLIESLIRQYRGMRAESREELTVVYRSWLSSEDVAKAGLAIALMVQLDLVDELPLLKKILEDVKAGRSNLPKYFAEFLGPAIEDLGSDRLPE
jgi:hypothetical protein